MRLCRCDFQFSAVGPHQPNTNLNPHTYMNTMKKLLPNCHEIKPTTKDPNKKTFGGNMKL